MGHSNCRRRVRPNGAAAFSAPADRGTRTALACSHLTGRHLSLHRKAGAHELPQACSPLTGGKFSAEPQRGDSPSADGGSVAAPAAGQKGRTTCGFPSSLNSYLSLGESGADCLYVTASKQGNGSRVIAACLSPPFRSSQTAYCYTYGLLYAGAT